MSAPPPCTLLVCSCDRYSDLWAPYFELLRRRWPDCPFPIALVTETSSPAIPNVRALCLGAGLDWSTLLARALDVVQTEYVLLTLEDFFLRRRVDSGRLLALLDDMRRANLGMLRLNPRPGPTVDIGSAEYGGIASDAPYRVSTQAAFWRVDALRSLLVAGESAWEFEVKGTPRAVAMPGFAGVWREAFPYDHHVVERGKWFPWSFWEFRRQNIGVDVTARPVMSTREAGIWLLGKALSPISRRIPQRMKQALKRVLYHSRRSAT